VHELTGTGRLTNYALTLLFIFYLQQPPAVLPGVQFLQRGAAAEGPLDVDHWDAAYCGLLPPPASASASASVAQLVGGFFRFYSTFNFDQMVVCPYLGHQVKKEVFSDVSLLPPEFHRYKHNVLTNAVYPMRINTSMCVQDPLEQCHNVASSVSSKLTAEIKAYFKFASDVYEKEKLTDCQKFLETILLQKPKIVKPKSHPEYRVNIFPRIVVTIIDPDWKPVVRSIVFDIFENILKIKLGKVEEKLNPDSRKEKEKYTGNVTKAIWKRKQFSRLYSIMKMDMHEKEAKITEEILKVEKEILSIQFQLTLTFCHDPKSAVITIKFGTGDVMVFREFGKFFISVMQSWFMELLKPFARPDDNDTAAKIADTLKTLEINQGANAQESDDEVVPSLVVTNSGTIKQV
jgi:hypothetical protein